LNRKKRKCLESGCLEPPFLGGLCKQHHEEEAEKSRRRTAAINALHTAVIEGRILDNLELRDELMQIRKWWDRACHSVNYNIKDEVLADEAKYAIEWCISLSQEIVDAEIAFRAGNNPSRQLEATREWVWERFHNLEAGLMSNGVKRQK